MWHTSNSIMGQTGGQYFRIIACEVALREISHAIAQSPNTVDLEFLSQGYHDRPSQGCQELQARIDAVPPGKYDAVLVGYGLCGNLISGIRADATPLVVPRAHDCITFLLGSKERYAAVNSGYPGAYFYSSGWLECIRRRGIDVAPGHPAYLPTRASPDATGTGAYRQWVEKYGEEKARHLLEVISGWTQNYTHGVLIDFDFTRPLHLHEQVQSICSERGWQFEQLDGDLRLLQRWVDGEWDERSFLVVAPGERIEPSYDDAVIRVVTPSSGSPPEARK